MQTFSINANNSMIPLRLQLLETSSCPPICATISIGASRRAKLSPTINGKFSVKYFLEELIVNNVQWQYPNRILIILMYEQDVFRYPHDQPFYLATISVNCWLLDLNFSNFYCVVANFWRYSSWYTCNARTIFLFLSNKYFEWRPDIMKRRRKRERERKKMNK